MKLFYYSSVATLALWFVFLIGIGFLWLAPHTIWFNYFSVESSESEYALGVHPIILSDKEVNYAVRFEYNDVLRCDNYDGYGFSFFSQYESAVNALPQARSISAWPYQANVPEFPAICYIDSTIRVPLPLGFYKEQKVVSKPFIYEPI